MPLFGSGGWSGGIEKWMVLRHIFKVEPLLFTVELNSENMDMNQACLGMALSHYKNYDIYWNRSNWNLGAFVYFVLVLPGMGSKG